MAKFILIFGFLFLFSSSLFAESCQCPVVQCDPCQRPLRLGTEELSCGLMGKMECDKIVCENVDNFFQCLAGEPALYIPPQNPMTRITEPVDPAEKRPQPIDFQKLSQSVQVEVVNDQVLMEPVEKVKSEKQISRQLASVEKKPEPFRFEIEKKSGSLQVNQKSFKKSVQAVSSFELTSKDKSEVLIRGKWGRVSLKLSPQSAVKIRGDEDVLWVDLHKGDMIFAIQEAKVLTAVDLGEWRFGKRTGSFGLSRSRDLVTLLNEEQDGFLRRNELIAIAQKIVPQKMLQFSVLDGVVAVRDKVVVRPAPRVYKMTSPLMSVAEARSPSSENLCLGPEAHFESCAWKCFGAGVKDKKCGVQKNSQCVRFTCAADGQWKLPTMAVSSECSVDVVRVGDCQ